jgi:hypothetical protein
MTPGLRSLFEETVEPLLELVRHREEQAAKEKAKARHESQLERQRKRHKTLEVLQRAAKIGGEKSAEDKKKRQEAAKALEQQIAKTTEMLSKASKAASTARAKAAQMAKRKAVVPALAELEAPIVEGKGEEEEGEEEEEVGADSIIIESLLEEEEEPFAAVAAATAAADAEPSPPTPKTPRGKEEKKNKKNKKTAKQQQQQEREHQETWLVTLLKRHLDPASMVLDFVGGASALKGIGTTSPSMRAAVKAALPRLALVQQYRNKLLPTLGGYPRLLDLTLRSYYRDQLRWAMELVSLGLPARLHSLRVRCDEKRFIRALAGQQWPQLRTLEVTRLADVLTAIAGNPAAVFPRLESLAVTGLSGAEVGPLLSLLHRGAFPALTAVVPSAGAVAIEPTTDEEMAQLCGVIDRLSLHGSLCLCDDRLGPETSWEPFATRLLGGRLALLKCVGGDSMPRNTNASSPSLCFLHLATSPKHPTNRHLIIYIGRNHSGHDLGSLFSAIGSGALPALESLVIEPPSRTYFDGAELGGGDFLPNSLPSLKRLFIDFPTSSELIAGLLSAAGAQLTTLEIKSSSTAPAVVRLIAEQDYPWLPSLQSLSLRWYGVAQMHPWVADMPRQVAMALPRLPALSVLTAACSHYDELFVRLMAMAEGSGIPRLPTLQLLSSRGISSDDLSCGARLLLLLWLKREAKKAVEGQGQGQGVKWEVQGLAPTYASSYTDQITKGCLGQINAAWAHVAEDQGGEH